MSQSIVQVDAFTDRPFAGNPAAVCLMQGPAEEKWMQRVALEMNLSETAFLYRSDNGFNLRWFTPKVEVDLCGHATLASAHVLYGDDHVPTNDTIRFQSRSGELTAQFRNGWIWLDFPAKTLEEVSEPIDILAAIGEPPRTFWRSSDGNFLIELESEEAVRKVKPDFATIGKYAGHGVIITARSSSADYDFVSRYFAPAFGIDEDPVTGSAHCTSAPYWQQRLRKDAMTAFQASSRGGTVKVEVRGDRIGLGGQAVTVMRGELNG